MRPFRSAITPPIFGTATFHITARRATKITTSQNSWLGYVAVSNGGKPPLLGWAAVPVVVWGASASISGEQQDQRDQKAEQALQLAKRVADVEVGELRGSRARIAQRARDVIAEHHADADTGTDEGDRRKARADLFCRLDIHE